MPAKGLRMTYGRLKGQMLRVPDSIRPTSAKVRSALMNSWQYRLPKARVLDVFAGSGSVGLEAIAKGAAQVLFVEGSASVIAVLKENCALQDTADTRIVRAQLPLKSKKLTALLGSRGGALGFDLIFVDPPYLFTEYDELLEELMSLLTESGELAIEHSSKRALPPRVVDNENYSVRTRIYGDSQLTIMAWENYQHYPSPGPRHSDFEETNNAS